MDATPFGAACVPRLGEKALDGLLEVGSGELELLLEPIGGANLTELLNDAVALEGHGDGVLGEDGRNGVAQATDDTVVLEGHDGLLALGLGEDELLVERLDAEHVDDLGGDALLLEVLGSVESVGDQGGRRR